MADEIMAKLKDHDKKFVEHDGQFKVINAKLVEHDGQLDAIAIAVAENAEALKNIQGTLGNYREDMSRVTQSLDTLVVLATKKDQELTILGKTVKEHTDKIDAHDHDIKLMKPLVVGMA